MKRLDLCTRFICSRVSCRPLLMPHYLIWMRNWEVHIETDFSLGDKVMMLATLNSAEETSEFPSFGQIMWDDGV